MGTMVSTPGSGFGSQTGSGGFRIWCPDGETGQRAATWVVGFTWKMVSWLCWDRIYSSCHYNFPRRGRCCSDNVLLTTRPKGSLHHYSKRSCLHSNVSSGFEPWWCMRYLAAGLLVLSIIFRCMGRFEILCLSGSYFVIDEGGSRNRSGGLCIALCGPDHRVIGGSVGGALTAAGTVQVIVGSFMYGGSKRKKKRKVEQEPENEEPNGGDAESPTMTLA